MKERARATAIVLAILLALSPVVYVGTEGAWYLAAGYSWFAPDTAYRKVYAPLDAASERFPALYPLRQKLAELWVALRSEGYPVLIDPKMAPI